MAGEKNFEERIKKWLRDNGVWHVKFFANRNTKSGVPDILACVGGTFVGIEVKGPRGRPSPLQVYHCRKIRESGGLAVIVWPEDFDRLKFLLTSLLDGGDLKNVPDVVFEGIYLHPVSL